MQKQKSKEYLAKIFHMLKRREDLAVCDKKTHFNSTEIRMIQELLAARYENRRLISSQLARLLGVTRSAVSQMVYKMEAEGVVVRLPDEKDKKIAYVELTEKMMKIYEQDLAGCLDFVSLIIEEFGTERFDTMYRDLDDFLNLIQEKIKQ